MHHLSTEHKQCVDSFGPVCCRVAGLAKHICLLHPFAGGVLDWCTSIACPGPNLDGHSNKSALLRVKGLIETRLTSPVIQSESSYSTPFLSQVHSQDPVAQATCCSGSGTELLDTISVAYSHINSRIILETSCS